MIKQGVDIRGIKHETVLAFSIAQRVYQRFGLDCCITSCRDGEHKRKSKHYDGYAIDLRTSNIPRNDRQLVCDRIIAALGQQFDVLLEPDHIHIEFDPR